MRDADPSSQAFLIFGGIRSALELAEEALALFEERLPMVIGYAGEFAALGGKRMELSQPGPLSNRGLIGAQAFLSNLVVAENGLRRLSRLDGLPQRTRDKINHSLKAIKSVVDRDVRNTIEHIDERAANAGTKSLISSTIVEGNLLCSTRADGSVGTVAITREALQIVVNAVNELLPG